MPKYGFDKTNRVGVCHRRGSRIPSRGGAEVERLNIEFSREASRELDLLDTFQLTNKPYPTGISAGNNVMPKVGFPAKTTTRCRNHRITEIYDRETFGTLRNGYDRTD